MKTSMCAGALALVGLFAVESARADCRGEVEAAFEKQRTTAPGYRVQAEQFQANGRVEIAITYMQPDRMQQKVMAPGEKMPIETIAVGRWAWGNMGGGWEELQPQFAQSVTAHVHDTLGQPVKATGEFECLGKVTFEGKELTGYRSRPVLNGPEGAPADGKVAQVVSRTVYVDPASGLPVHNVVAETDNGAPWVKTRFEYPKDIAIEAPVGAQPAPRTR